MLTRLLNNRLVAGAVLVLMVAVLLVGFGLISPPAGAQPPLTFQLACANGPEQLVLRPGTSVAGWIGMETKLKDPTTGADRQGYAYCAVVQIR